MNNLERKKFDQEILSSLIDLIPKIKEFHSPNSNFYNFFANIAKVSSYNLFGPNHKNDEKINFGPLGDLIFPYFNMGSIDSTHLFGLDELILFSFYLQNKGNYKKVADLGANIGLHSIILSNLGFEVTSYEPDLIHFNRIKENIALNCDRKKPNIINKAVSTDSGFVEFIRVKGNTTGSHIAGSKDAPYGDLETIKVETDSFKDIVCNFDFLKIDVEGHEANILTSTSRSDWLNTDAMVEVGTSQNAESIYEFFKLQRINLFSQKNCWAKVENLSDMPTSYKDGSLFISNKIIVPWG